MRRPTAQPPAGDPSTSDILVVDDHPENLVAIESALRGLGAGVVTVTSGRAALRWLLHHHAVVILLDVKMPDLDGMETARMVRERKRTRHLPIIFMTAYGREEVDVLDAYRLGAVDFLFKPIQTDVLRAKVGVFVELQRRAEEVRRQALELRAHERREASRKLAAQRRRLEAKALRDRLDEERRHAEELESLNARLEADDRRKDEFLAVLAHELRNPLASLVAGLELLDPRALHGEGPRDGDGLDESGRVMVNEVLKRQASHLVRLVDDLLDVSRVARGKIELHRAPVRLRVVIAHVRAMTDSLLARHRHQLTVSGDADHAVVEGDEVRLAQILCNLLHNAARYTGEGGEIELRVTREQGGVVLAVRDNGDGIAPDLVERIFEPFVQARDGHSGLGIGLTLVRQLVELHGGWVTASSDGPRCGSEFRVWLPEVDADATASVVAPDEDIGVGSTPLHVALVEDNDDTRTLLAQLIEGWGHRVSTAGTGQEGIALLTRERPDIAFVDLGLPDMEGYDVARAVCRLPADSRPRLIALSGYSQPDDRRRSKEAGFEDHLAKPARTRELRRLLASNATPIPPSSTTEKTDATDDHGHERQER